MTSENNKCWTVYYHENLINGKRYVGVTTQTLTDRARSGHGYYWNPNFKKDILKYGWKNFSHTILGTVYDEETAYSLEQHYIRLFNTTDPNIGYNVLKGGKYGGEICEYANKLKYDKMRGEKSVLSKPVVLFDSDGNRFAVFCSARAAAEYLGVSGVAEYCKSHGGTVKGFMCRYLEDVGDISQLPNDEIRIPKSRGCGTRVILMYDLDGNYIRSFSKVGEALSFLGVAYNRRGQIYSCLRGKYKHALGYVWKLSKENEIEGVG